MGRKVIDLGIDKGKIDEAIKELRAYKLEFQEKVNILRRRIAEEIQFDAAARFGSSTMEHLISGETRKPNVTVRVDDAGYISVVVADGEDAVWCEFGAGVYLNGSVGTSPNPYGEGLGFTIGSYGKGYGKGNAWGYYDESGELVITRGTPASMPMYNAVKDVTKRVIDIARGVFK